MIDSVLFQQETRLSSLSGCKNLDDKAKAHLNKACYSIKLAAQGWAFKFGGQWIFSMANYRLWSILPKLLTD
jgi:hypothetical protein